MAEFFFTLLYLLGSVVLLFVLLILALFLIVGVILSRPIIEEANDRAERMKRGPDGG